MKKIPALLLLSIAWVTLAAASTDMTPSIVINFESGKSRLTSNDKEALRKLLDTYQLGPESRVFVVGYTDAAGDKNSNYRLSLRRAEAVRIELIRHFAIEGKIVMALGKGAENPVADNKNPRGRALNRRCEIYLTSARLHKPERVYGPSDPYFSDIQTMVHDAEMLIKKRQLDEAFQKLHKARAIGGDHYSDWHAVYAIAGYYAMAPVEQIRAHLETALKLDRYNFKAREYLGRTEARRKVFNGEVKKEMGRSRETAIPITALAQQDEYLSLFEVQPIAQKTLPNGFVTQWQCLDKDGGPIVYYFNHSTAYQWALAQPAAGSGPVSGSSRLEITDIPLSEAGNAKQDTTSPADRKKARQIWDSKIFH